MQNKRRFSSPFFSATRIALASVVLGMAFGIAGCGSKKDDSLPPPPAAAAASGSSASTPSQQDAIKKQADEERKN